MATIETVLSRLPVATVSTWFLTTTRFDLPANQSCSQSAVIGLGFIVAVLGLVLWIRGAVFIYNKRKQARTTWPWKILAIAEASTLVLLFAVIVLLTPPGSTCLLPAATPGTTKVDQLTLYSVLTIAILASLMGPSVTDWLLTIGEAFGMHLRTESTPQQDDSGFMAHKGDHWTLHGYGWVHRHVHSDHVQRLLWQLLPVTAIPLYKVGGRDGVRGGAMQRPHYSHPKHNSLQRHAKPTWPTQPSARHRNQYGCLCSSLCVVPSVLHSTCSRTSAGGTSHQQSRVIPVAASIAPTAGMILLVLVNLCGKVTNTHPTTHTQPTTQKKTGCTMYGLLSNLRLPPPCLWGLHCSPHLAPHAFSPPRRPIPLSYKTFH